MTTSVCTIEDCERPNFARGWCAGHYQRNRKYGDPLAGGPLGVRGAARGKTCERDECDAPVHSRNLCGQHRREASREGLVAPWSYARPRRTLEETVQFFWDNVAVGEPTDCWPWQRQPDRGGYGQLWDGEQRVSAHVYAYELANGSVPEGMQVDHICHNRAFRAGECVRTGNCQHRRCCNAEHLRAVPGEVNRARITTA